MSAATGGSTGGSRTTFVLVGLVVALLVGIGGGLAAAALVGDDDDTVATTSASERDDADTGSDSSADEDDEDVEDPADDEDADDRRTPAERRQDREDRRQAAGEPPTMQDHWHAAYGIYVCDRWMDPLYDQGPDVTGIHTHEDGIVHIHPFDQEYTGEGATLGVFLDLAGVTLEDTRMILPDESFLADGEDCPNGEPGVWVVARFQPDLGDQAEEVVTEDLAGTRFLADREAFTIAFIPEGTEIPMPESVPMLDQLSDVNPGG